LTSNMKLEARIKESNVGTKKTEDLDKQINNLAAVASKLEQKESTGNKFRALCDICDAIPNPVMILDPQQNVLAVNPAMIDVINKRKDKIVGKKCYKIFCNKSVSRSHCLFKKTMRSANPKTIKAEINVNNTWFRISCIPILNNAGELEQIVHMATDITEDKEIEAALGTCDLLKASILEAIPHAVVALHERCILEANKGVEDVFGWKSHEIIGKTTRVFYRSEEEFKEIGRRFYPLLEKVRSHSEEFPCRRKDGRDIICRVTAARIGGALDEKKIAVVYEDITERKHSENEIKHKTKDLNLINSLNNAVNQGKSLQEIIQLLSRQIEKTFMCNGAMLMLISEDGEHLVLQKALVNSSLIANIEKIIGTMIPDLVFSIKEGDMYRKALQEGKGQLIDNPDVLRELSNRSTTNKLSRKIIAAFLKKFDIKSVIICPLLCEDTCIGFLNVVRNRSFTKTELKRFEAIAEEVTLILSRKQTDEKLQMSIEEIKKTLEEIIQVLIATSEKRDPYTAGHQERTTKLAIAIAGEIGLSEEQIKSISVAGMVHDIGKISIPSEILNKPSKLTETEMDLIRIHPQAGYELLENISFPWPVAEIVLHHHERMNGSGYPNSLVGKDIPLEARILAVADVVEAMASHRPYRAAHPLDVALNEVYQNRDTLYDPDVVDACLKLFNEKHFSF